MIRPQVFQVDTQALFDTATGRYIVRFTDEDIDDISGNPYAKTKCFTLKDGVYFKALKTLTGTEKTYEKGLFPQWYLPRGITDPLVIHLGDQKGRFYTLFLNRYAGRMDIRKGRWEYNDYLKELVE